MNKLRDRRGFTLTELLCAVLIVLLVSALLTVGVRFAGRTYNSSMQLSEAQELCSTLTSVISDKLRFCGTVTPGADGSLDHIFIQDLGSVEGEGAAFQVDADGQLTLGSTKLLSSAAYPRGLRVRDVSLRYDSASGIFTVTLQVGTADSTLAETSFEVRRLNHTRKSSASRCCFFRLASMKKKHPRRGAFLHFLKLSFRDTLRLNTICAAELSRLSRQK